MQQSIQSTDAPRTASAIAARASELVGGDRDRQHGSKRDNFENIAAVWNAYLNIRRGDELDGADVGHMMALMKIARTQSGALNVDDYVDGAGYMACAGEVAQDYADADRECQAAIEGGGIEQESSPWWGNPFWGLKPDDLSRRSIENERKGVWRLVPEFEIGDRVRGKGSNKLATVREVTANGFMIVRYDDHDHESVAQWQGVFERVQ